MSAYRKNVMVGITVLGALLILGWMILQFGPGVATVLVEKRMPIHFVCDRADGLTEGSAIHFRGITIGQVVSTRRTPDNKQIIIDATVEKKPPLPGNVIGLIRSVGLIGAAATISIETVGPAEGKTLQPGQEIKAKFVGLDVLPPEFADLAHELRQVAHQFRESNIVQHMDDTIVQANKTIQSVQKVIGDDQVQKDLKQSITDFRDTMDRAKRTAANIEKFTEGLNDISTNTNDTIKRIGQQMSDRILQIAKALDAIQSITSKMNEGKGTAGLLLNDPKLYQGLVNTSEELNATIKDLRRLVEQWEQEGLSLKLR